MKATDITWGGESKAEFTVESKIAESLSVGAILSLGYDHVSQTYFLVFENHRYTITPTSTSNKVVLEDCVTNGKGFASLVRIIDIEGKSVIVQIHKFMSVTVFNSLQSLKIQLGDMVVEKFPPYARPDPVKFAKDEFLYNENIVFVIGSHRTDKDFAILSNRWRLHVMRKDNAYIASNITRNRSDNIDCVHMLQGSINFLDSTQGASVSNEVSEKLHRISNPESYFMMWDAYNELEKIYLLLQAVENGVAEYTSYTFEEREDYIYKFRLKNNNWEDLFGEDSQIDCTDNEEILKIDTWEKLGEMQDIRPIHVGQVVKVENGYMWVVDKNSDSKKRLPQTGYLFKSVSGDKVRIQRRDDAQNEIVRGEAPLPNLALLINDGVSSIKPIRNEQPITKKLLRSLKKNVSFNKEQTEAIRIALNTPDMALIQGPPGTGKTTVIKAIIARYEEFYKKINLGEMPAILVSSFQHEAVDNIIEGMNPSGLPANRIGGRRGEKEKRQVSLEEWADSMRLHCSNMAKDCETPAIYAKLNLVRDSVFSWHAKGKDLLEGIQMLQGYAKEYRQDISPPLIDQVHELVSKASLKENCGISQKLKDIENEPIIQILSGLRTTQASFQDDGFNRAVELKFAIVGGLFENISVPQCLIDVISQKGKNEVAFKKYAAFVEQLKKQYITETQLNEKQPIRAEELARCFDDLLIELNTALLQKRENRNEAKARILYEFMDEIQNPKEVKSIVEKYSNIRAATCQQAMEIGRGATKSIYDLVIIDEAARANPLDLFIPMSMGKQIILVGDHKQLPHLLEPEVKKRLIQDQKYRDLEILDKSLFERLFELFEVQQRANGVARTCKLTEQYRMHPLINDFVSEAFYDGALRCGVDEAFRKMSLDSFKNKPLVWIDVNKKKYGLESQSRSKCREKEAIILLDFLKEVVTEHTEAQVGIITFYLKQKELIESLAESKLARNELSRVSIGTVDAFQGKEFDVVFLSCVRSNNEKADNLKRRVGFLNDPNRLCVSFSRAKSLLVAVGDSDTISVVDSIKKLIDICKEEKGCFISA